MALYKEVTCLRLLVAMQYVNYLSKCNKGDREMKTYTLNFVQATVCETFGLCTMLRQTLQYSVHF